MIRSAFHVVIGLIVAIVCTALVGCRVYSTTPVPPRTLVIEMTGHDYEWHIRFPGPDDQLHTPDDVVTMQHMQLPVGANVRLELRSQDFLYTLALPELELKEIAVPDLEFALEFTTPSSGMIQLRGDQMCGYQHQSLIGSITVVSPDAFDAWLAEQHA